MNICVSTIIIVWMVCVTTDVIQANIYQNVLDKLKAEDDPRIPNKRTVNRKQEPEFDDYKEHVVPQKRTREDADSGEKRDSKDASVDQTEFKNKEMQWKQREIELKGTIANLEKEKKQHIEGTEKQMKEHQLQWEQREEELKGTIDKLKEQQNKIAETAGKKSMNEQSLQEQQIIDLKRTINTLETQQKEHSEHSLEDKKQLTDCQVFLKEKLQEKTNCLSKVQIIQSELEKASEEKESAGISYFKQLMRKIEAMLKPVDGDSGTLGTKLILRIEVLEELQNILKKNSNAKEILDIFHQHPVFQPLEPSISIYSEFLNTQIDMQVVFITIAVISTMLFIMFLLRRLFFQEVNWRRQVVFIIFVGFLFSIPWEWYRMYRVALSKKTSMMLKDIPAECNPNGLSVWQSVTLYFRTTFTFSDDKCVKYQESLLVDPLWEVSPLQATSVCLSRFFFEPMKYFSAAFGESFRLFFNEIPAQWQPFLFIAFVVIILFFIVSFSGLRIETPLLKINVNPQPEIRYIQQPAPQPPAPQIAAPQIAPPQIAPPQIAAPQIAPPEVIQQNPVFAGEDKQQRVVHGDVIQNDDVVVGPGLRRRKLLPSNAKKDNNDEDFGVVNIGMLSCEPPAAILNTEHEPVSVPKLLKREEVNSVAEDSINESSDRVLPQTSAGEPSIVNKELQENVITDLPKVPIESYHSLGPELKNDVNSHLREDRNFDGPDSSRSEPNLNQFSIRALQEEKVHHHDSSCSSKCIFSISSGVLVPDPSSVFSMPLGMGPSIAEISDAPDSILEVPEPNEGTLSSDDMAENIGAVSLSSTDDGYLLVNE